MKNFVSCHAQRFKKSQVVGLSKHHKRELHKDENVIKEFSHHNRSMLGRLSFDELEMSMIAYKKKAGKKASNLAFRKDANVMLDNVITLSRERVEQLRKEHPDEWQDLILNCCVKLANGMQKAWGFTPFSIDLHCDEGRFENGEFLCNYHVHLSLFNFDFKNLVQPMRTMKRSDFSAMQDMAGDAFQSLGFVRGQAKEITGKRHLEKNEFVTEQLREKSQEIEALRSKALGLESEIQALLKGKAQAELEHSKALQSLDLAQSRLGQLEEQAQAIVAKSARLELQLTRILEPKTRQKRQELEVLERAIEESRNPLTARESALKRKCEALESEIEAYKQQFGELNQDHQLDNLMLNDPTRSM